MPLVFSQVSRFAENFMRDFYLAQVMKKATESKMFERGTGKPNVASEAQGQNGDVYGVRIGVVVVVFNGAQTQEQGFVL
jgi:hypothetical protein